ncbi:MAG TPA: glycosyltransferase family 4 protein [Gemmatimonadaceae bacterium]
MSLLYTARALDPDRYVPLVALARPSEPLHALYENAGIDVVAWPGLALWDHSTVAPRRLYHVRSWWKLGQVAAGWRRTARRTMELLDHTRADLIHLNSMPLAPSAAALNAARVPYVWHVREPPLPAFGLRFQAIRHIMRRANALIFISEADRRAWVGTHRADVIHNFVDLAHFHPVVDGVAGRVQLGIGFDDPVVLYVGGLSKAKGVSTLLKAMTSVAQRVPGVRCLMPGVGDGTAASASETNSARSPTGRFQHRVRALGLSDVIITTPFVTDIAPYIAACDVVVFPARRPHFARPAIEAAAMGKPVIASRFPVMEELIEDGVSGRLVPPGDAGALASELGTLLSDRPRARRLGAAGRQLAIERFDVHRQVARIMDVYDRVLRVR